jgi:hypothetical protein
MNANVNENLKNPPHYQTFQAQSQKLIHIRMKGYKHYKVDQKWWIKVPFENPYPLYKLTIF